MKISVVKFEVNFTLFSRTGCDFGQDLKIFNTSATHYYLVIYIANDEILKEFPLRLKCTCAIPSFLSMR